ncbi:hypothetical protein [Butyrivibrio sp. NC3005]|uniref:hypothetical protein n=1 Tax=Butyrivibrio sp. NC3005 TaxID=1280685 RepID=UPI00040D66B5
MPLFDLERSTVRTDYADMYQDIDNIKKVIDGYPLTYESIVVGSNYARNTVKTIYKNVFLCSQEVESILNRTHPS